MSDAKSPFHAAPLIREIGRGKKGARDMSQADAQAVYAAILAGRVSDLELGALLIGMRIKGESAAEIAGFMEAARASFELLAAPDAEFAPVLIPSYNGSRQLPNLTPLLALLLAREGVPVLVHGMTEDPSRVTSAEIFNELGIVAASDRAALAAACEKSLPAFMPISVLAPNIYSLLQLRRILGLRNSTHTLVKLLQPFQQPALRLVSYTHPEYLPMLSTYFLTMADPTQGDVFLMRGTEGETVAHPRRANAVTWFHEGQAIELIERQPPNDELPALPAASDAPTTARWIEQALAGRQPIPTPISVQVEHCLRVARQLRA
ncbi:MAG: DNA-binding protein YbiB [Burkholderiaceae bacterium]